MSKLNTSYCTLSKQYNKNDEDLMVVDCSDAVTLIAIEQEYHNKARLSRKQISSKLLGLDIQN